MISFSLFLSLFDLSSRPSPPFNKSVDRVFVGVYSREGIYNTTGAARQQEKVGEGHKGRPWREGKGREEEKKEKERKGHEERRTEKKGRSEGGCCVAVRSSRTGGTRKEKRKREREREKRGCVRREGRRGEEKTKRVIWQENPQPLSRGREGRARIGRKGSGFRWLLQRSVERSRRKRRSWSSSRVAC